MGSERIAPHRRCIDDAARCGAHVSPHRRRQRTADVAGASPSHRRYIGDALAMRRDPPTPS
eukprot:641609-Pyramimonas_sp.AAC.1